MLYLQHCKQMPNHINCVYVLLVKMFYYSEWFSLYMRILKWSLTVLTCRNKASKLTVCTTSCNNTKFDAFWLIDNHSTYISTHECNPNMCAIILAGHKPNGKYSKMFHQSSKKWFIINTYGYFPFFMISKIKT